MNAPIGSGWNLDITDGTLTTPPVYQLTDEAAHIASVRMPDGQILRFSPKLVFARDYSRLASVLDSDGDDVAQAWIPLGNNRGAAEAPRWTGGRWRDIPKGCCFGEAAINQGNVIQTIEPDGTASSQRLVTTARRVHHPGAAAKIFDKACVPRGVPAVTPVIKQQIKNGQWDF